MFLHRFNKTKWRKENEKASNDYFYVDQNGVKWNCTGDIGYIKETGELFVQGRANDFTVVNDKKIYNFDIEKIISTYKGVKICDVLPKADEQGQQVLAAHIIFEDDIDLEVSSDSKRLNQVLLDIQNSIYEEFKDFDMVPKVFKIRKNFPYAKSGKRDISKIKSETDGFIYLNNDEIIKYQNFTKTIKRGY